MSEIVQYLPSALKGARVPVYLWLPEGEVKAVIQFVHGMAEHMERYDESARYLAARGFAVVGHTHCGHGAETALPGYFGHGEGWDNLLSDIHQVRLWARERFPGLPYFMLGHSMGSFLTRCYLLDHADGLAGAVLSGTGFYPRCLTLAAKALSGAFILAGRGKKPSPFINQFVCGDGGTQWLSRDENAQAAYAADPTCGFVFTAWGFFTLFTGLDRLAQPKKLKAIPPALPVYLFSGDRDPVGQMGEGVKKVAKEYQTAGLTRVTLKLYPEGRHEMFNEINRREVYRDLAAWLEAQVKD